MSTFRLQKVGDLDRPPKTLVLYEEDGIRVRRHRYVCPVRCIDCKHATPDTSGRKRYEGYLWCDELTEGIGFSVAPSDFCAWGETEEGEI